MTKDDKAKIQLFNLVKEYITDGWSNARIREFFKEGIEVGVDDHSNMVTYPFRFRVEVLTDGFLSDARDLISNMENKNG